MTLAHAPVTFALGVCPSQGHTFASTHTPWQLHLHHDCRHHIQLMASTAPQATLPSLTNLHHPYPIGYVCINRWHQAASPSTSGSVRYLYISRTPPFAIICANNCTSTYSNTHPKQRPPITPPASRPLAMHLARVSTTIHKQRG